MSAVMGAAGAVNPWAPAAAAAAQALGQAVGGPNSAEGSAATKGSGLDGSNWIINFSGTQNASATKVQPVDDAKQYGLGSGLAAAPVDDTTKLALLGIAAVAVLIVVIKRRKKG